MEAETYNLDPNQPSTIEGKCYLCGHVGILIWDAVTYICQDFNACVERGKAIQTEYDRLILESYTRASQENDLELEKHRIPIADQIWHLDYEVDGDESGFYDTEIYSGTITLYGPFYGFDDTGCETIDIDKEDDAKFIIEKLNRLIELEQPRQK